MASAKTNLEDFITNTTIPVLERAKIWCKSPNAFKNHEKYIQHFPKYFEELLNGDTHKYETIDVSEFINDIIDCAETKEQLIENLTEYFDVEVDDKFLKEFEDFLEQVLSKNLGSYEFDW